MSKLSAKIAYDQKVAELRVEIGQEAKKLQNVKESVDNSLQELRSLAEKKSSIAKIVEKLEQQKKEEQEAIDQLIAKKEIIISSTKQENNKEKQSLSETKTNSKKLEEQFEEMSKASLELINFVEKEKDARIKYLKKQEELVKIENTSKEIRTSLEIQQQQIDSEKKDLDYFKKYLTDLYGRMGSYVAVMKETVEIANESMKNNGVPIRFHLPSDEMMNIDLNNFDKTYEQT